MPDSVDEVPGTAETGRDEPLCSIVRPCCGRESGHSCPIVFEHPLKLDGQSPTVHRLDSEPSRRHRPGHPYQTLPITMWTKKSVRKFYLKTPHGPNCISIFISRASSAATDAGYGIRPPSPTILLLLNPFPQPLATIPCLRAPTSGLSQLPPILHPTFPSSSPPLHTHLRNLSVVDLNPRPPNTHRTLRRYSAPALCVFSSYSIGCASIKRRTSARISSFIASNV